MADPEDIFALAGEYALGTLDPAERMEFGQLLVRDPLAVKALSEWQERLVPLALTLPPVTPPLHLLARIEGTIAGVGVLPIAANDNRVARWRFGAIAAALVALIAGGLALRPGAMPSTAPQPNSVAQPIALTSGVAALTAGGTTPALIVTHDSKTGQLKVIPVNMPDDALHSFELWAIKGKAAPKPMGLIDPRKPGAQLPRMNADDDVTLAVSLEPVGGSPTGLPTGPVLYSGKLVPTS
jgi:anti-sigma-K factor RskA